MLGMKEKAILVFMTALAAVITAGLIRASWIYSVELVLSRKGPTVWSPAGRPFNVSCEVSGGDEARVSSMKWLGPDGNAVPEGHPGVEKSGNNALLLSFSDPKPEEGGTYKCAATYAEDHHLLHSVDIVFYGPAPEFDHFYENITVTEGDTVELHCSATGEMPMTYEWYNPSGDAISKLRDSPFKVSTTAEGMWLIVPEAKLSHEGTYTCNVNNTHGLASKLFHLNVRKRSGSNDTDSVFRVVNVSTNGVRLRIDAQRPAEYVEVLYKESRDSQNQRRRFKIDPDNIYEIGDLVPAGLYVFQFRIVPSKDNDTWSEELRATLLPEAPHLILRRLEQQTLELEWFRGVDDIMRGTVDKHEITYYSVQMQSGNYWVRNDCAVTIHLPSCRGSSYVISGLQPKVYYQVEVRAHTASGYGEPAVQKIYTSA